MFYNKYNYTNKRKTDPNTFNIWEFRRLNKKELINYIEKYEVPETITVREKEEMYDEINYGDYSCWYNTKQVPTWDLIAESWNLSEKFILKYIDKLNPKILLSNTHIKISDSTRVALRLMK